MTNSTDQKKESPFNPVMESVGSVTGFNNTGLGASHWFG